MLRQHISEKSFIINDNSAWKYIKYNIYEQKQYLSKTKFGYTFMQCCYKATIYLQIKCLH